MWQDYLAEALVALLLALLNAALAYLTAYLRKRYTAEQMRLALDVAAIAVGAVEQMFRRKGVDPATKYAQAKEFAMTLARQYGINLTEQQVQTLIERAVYEMNQAKGALTTDNSQ